MDMKFKEKFLARWNKHFPGAELPLGCYYSNAVEPIFLAKPARGHRCIVADLAKARKGKTISFNAAAIGCGGGKRYLGFEQERSPDFEYFLSFGIPGRLEGERYKKSPELVKEYVGQVKPFEAPGNFITFKRWDQMAEGDMPLVVIFFAYADALSGLFTLANFDQPQPFGVIAPFCAGCASIVDYPLKELRSAQPRAVLGMFDVSARPCVPRDSLTFAVPWQKFVQMVDNMDESFLITKSWSKVRARIRKASIAS